MDNQPLNLPKYKPGTWVYFQDGQDYFIRQIIGSDLTGGSWIYKIKDINPTSPSMINKSEDLILAYLNDDGVWFDNTITRLEDIIHDDDDDYKPTSGNISSLF